MLLFRFSRNQGSKKYTENEYEKYIRLFVIVPKEMGEKELSDEFGQFGELDSISLIRDKVSGERKGFAYIKYRKYVSIFVYFLDQLLNTRNLCRFSEAATAFESCDRRFKAVFAEPKPTRNNSSSNLSMDGSSLASSISSSGDHHYGRRMSGPGGGGSKEFINTLSTFPRSFNNSSVFANGLLATNGTTNSNGGGQLIPIVCNGQPPQEYTLNVICSAAINQDQLWRLFDIIPGLDYCQITGELGSNSHRAIVKYNNYDSAAYAKEKLHGLEYPLGERLIVKMDLTAPHHASPPSMPARSGDPSKQQQMVDNFCNVPLPPPAPLAFTGSACVQRCFLVCVSQVSF